MGVWIGMTSSECECGLGCRVAKSCECCECGGVMSECEEGAILSVQGDQVLAL